MKLEEINTVLQKRYQKIFGLDLSEVDFFEKVKTPHRPGELLIRPGENIMYQMKAAADEVVLERFPELSDSLSLDWQYVIGPNPLNWPRSQISETNYPKDDTIKVCSRYPVVVGSMERAIYNNLRFFFDKTEQIPAIDRDVKGNEFGYLGALCETPEQLDKAISGIVKMLQLRQTALDRLAAYATDF